MDEQIDRLYSLPLGEFVERRNELARSLRKNGNRGAADEVGRLRKPTLPAWTVNQLARREKMRLRGLLTAGERLRKAQEELLGGGSPEALQRGRDDERRAISELTGAAEALLEEAGHPASEMTLERVRETLHAAVADEAIGGRVREGRLDKEEQITGFGFGNLPVAPAERLATSAAAHPKPRDAGDARSGARDKAAREKRAQDRKAKQEAVRKKHLEAEERLRGARRAVKEAERAVKNRKRELKHAESALSSRQVEVESAERQVKQARRSLER